MSRLRYLTADVSWAEEKNGHLYSSAVEYPAENGESFNGASVICSDCGLTSIPCACCLDCGQVQERVMERGERCAECMAKTYDEGDSINSLGLSGLVIA